MFSSLIKVKVKVKSLSLSHQRRCLSSSIPPPTEEALHNLRSFFRVGINQTTTTTNPYDHELALVSALKSCSSLSAVSQGRQIHSLVTKSGLVSNTFVANSLISMYAKSGLIAEARTLFDTCPTLDLVSRNIMVSGYVRDNQFERARQVFDEMPERTCVGYTSLIMGFSRNERWTEAVSLFNDMRSENVVPNDVTMTTVISSCVNSNLSTVRDCRALHCLVVKLHLLWSVFVSTNLLNLYCTRSLVDEARALFDETGDSNKNIVSWNVMLNGYSKSGLVNQAEELFVSIPMKDVVSWGTIIDALVRAGRLKKALSTCRDMVRNGLRPNDVMIVDLISACGRFEAFEEGKQFHCLVLKQGFDRHDFVQSTIISFYANCGNPNLARLQFELGSKDHVASWNSLIAGYIKNDNFEHAAKVFNEMPERDVFSWSIMISGHTRSRPDSALKLFEEMVSSGVKANEITMVSVLSSIASLGSLPEAKRAHEYIRTNSIPLNENLIAAIIDTYAKSGSIDLALKAFYLYRDIVSAVSPWNAILCGLAMNGHGRLALEIFSDLSGRPIEPNAITFIGVLTACCHAGMVDLGRRYFDTMERDYNVERDIRHYGCVVDLLGRAGRLEEAEGIITKMPMAPDVVIWGTLLAACKTHGNVEIGERAAERLAGMEPGHGPGRVMLSSIYAGLGRWDEAFSVRRDMRVRRVKKSPGCSGVM